MRHRPSGFLAVVVAALLCSFAPPLHAQSLADIARREAERRQNIPEPSKVYTEKDLKPVPPPTPQPGATTGADTGDGQASTAEAGNPAENADGTAAAGAASSSDAASAPSTDASASAGSTRTQAEWAAGMKERQDKLERDRVLLESVQNRVNSLNADFTARDDPAQRELIAQDRQRSLDELDRLRRDISADQQAISDYEDEARRAGVPPGWLRN